jgi:hypothetical protein
MHQQKLSFLASWQEKELSIIHTVAMQQNVCTWSVYNFNFVLVGVICDISLYMRLSIIVCYVILDAGFGEATPEAKAAKNLHNFFTYTAVKIVAAQLEVSPSFICLCCFSLFSSFFSHELFRASKISFVIIISMSRVIILKHMLS